MASSSGQASARLSSSSSHRLPTVSASQALLNLKASGSSAISTGLKQLDLLLCSNRIQNRSVTSGEGLRRGQITEVHGPPGIGKTTLGMQTSVSALYGGDRVVWVDAGTQLAGPRLNEILTSFKPSNGKQISSSAPVTPRDDDIRSRFHHYIAPTLAHLLAMCTAPMFLPAGTALLVIDSVSTLFDNAYPRNTDDRSNGNKNNDGKWAASRRFSVMNDLMSKLSKLAALNNIAVLVTCQTATRMRAGLGAVLLPALSGTEWDNGISTRLVLFRDWPPPAHKDMSDADRQLLGKVRYAGAIKVNGVTLADIGTVGNVVPFTIQAHGLADFDIPSSSQTVQYHTSPVRPPKRTYAEIADSDGEEDEYGWGNGDEDEVLAAEGLVDDALAIDLTATEAGP